MKLSYKVKEKKLEKENICKYIIKDEETYYFANKKHNWLFIKNEQKNGNMFLAVENWLYEFYNTIEKTSNMPSIAAFDSITTPDRIKEHCNKYIVDFDNEDALINQKSVITLLDSADFDKIMKKIIESRNDNLFSKELIVVLDGIDKNKYPNLMTYLTLAKSRNIYFIVVSYDKEDFEENNSLIKDYFDIKYLCNKDEIQEISITEFGKNEIIKL